ncbi:MAG: response regulator [Desulfovibrio sp.]
MQNMNILIVDDSKSALYAIETLLGASGVRITTASDGLEGQAKLKQRRFDLVITDVDMPELDGIEFCRWIKSNSSTADIPVIVLSSYESDADIEKGFQVGADAYVPKSIAKTELIPRIEEVMHKSACVRNKTVLVVEDSRSIQSFAMEGLDAAGFKVMAANDGMQALEIIQNVTPDLVLTDLNMPNLNGGELCRKLFSMDPSRKLPVVVMSSMGDKPVMQRLIQDGVTAFIVKPFNIDMLVLTVEKVLSNHFRRIMEERERLVAERKLMLGSIASLVNALEARDSYTRGHSESVTRISSAIGKEMGLTDAQLDRLLLTGTLHDLGKIGVRDSVLLKPGNLTAEEYEHIKTHSVIVKDILYPLHGLDDVILGASSHHERWDGSGYPDGLKGPAIPLFGRIIAVADVYDALTSDRPYRDGMPRDKALKIIAEGRGTHFCPDVVDAFFRYIEKEGG